MLATRAPVAAASFAIRTCALFAWRRVLVALRTWTLPSTFALAATRITCRVARVKELTALEPLHHCGRVLLFQPVEGRQQFLGIVRTERGRLIVDQDGPIRVARWHVLMIVRSAKCVARSGRIAERLVLSASRDWKVEASV